MKKNKLFVSLLASGMLAISPAMAQDVVSFTTSKQIGETVTLQVNQPSSGSIQVDWGDGVPVTVNSSEDDLLTITGVLKKQTFSITSTSKIETLVCDNLGLTAIDLAKAKNLLSVYCQNNALTTLDVAGCAKLTDLNCANNKINKLILTIAKNPLLENVNLSGNEMTTNTGSGTAFAFSSSASNLQHVDISNNKFASVSAGLNSNLDEFKCANNSLKTLSLAGSPSLSVLMCGDNAITSVTLNAKQDSLQHVFVENNKIKILNVSNASKLKYLAVENNQLTKVNLYDFSSSEKLGNYTCGGNSLFFNSFPSKVAVKNISYLPQNGEIDITSKLNYSYADKKYYMLVCADRSDFDYTSSPINKKYVLDLRDLMKNASGVAGQVIARFYGVPAGSNADEASIHNNTYLYSASGANRGCFGFKKALGVAYAKISSKEYTGLTFMTNRFTVVNNVGELTGIEDAKAAEAESFAVRVVSGGIEVTAPKSQAVRVFSTEGKLVWQGIVEGSQTINLNKGLYLVNGKKVVL